MARYGVELEMGNVMNKKCLASAMALPQTMARTMPDPNQKHAPGNETPQKPISQAGYSTPVN